MHLSVLRAPMVKVLDLARGLPALTPNHRS